MNSVNLNRLTLYFTIFVIGFVLIWQLQFFIPGFLLAITFYILLRKTFFHLTIIRQWKKWMAALMLIFLTLLILSIPIWVVVEILIPKIEFLVNNSSQLIEHLSNAVNEIKQRFPEVKINDEQLQNILQRVVEFAPRLLGTTAGIITNLLTAYFILYFMLLGGIKMELRLSGFLPLKPASKESIWQETHKLVVSNAIGIPLLAFLQSIVAAIGYGIFGIEGFIIWGLMTGICSLLPVIGTMVVWIPLVVYLIAIGNIGAAIGLGLYSIVIISNIDNVMRFTLMKRIGDVHPLITVFGVIAGLKLFGIMGLIFGPLLISYFILLIRIYRSEFKEQQRLG